MSEYRINKLHGILLEDDRVPNLIENQFDSSTKTMLENLVREGNGTTQILLDPSNTDQGYISYTQPSTPSAGDDYFAFDSLDYSIALPLNRDGTVVVTEKGKFYNNFIQIISQTPDGDFEVYFTIFDSLDMKNSNKSGMIERLKAIITAANELSVTGRYSVTNEGTIAKGNYIVMKIGLIGLLLIQYQCFRSVII